METQVMTHRLMPPADGKNDPMTVNGRVYKCAPGASIDVPDQDAFVMLANGWVTAAGGGADTTVNRPRTLPNGQPLPKGLQFHDTTLNITVVWDGKTWRNPNTGAAA
jgi:hypothetical protein